jgi:acyclic terpene utilization AtuA family protein
MKELSVLAATGMLGSGFRESSIEQAIENGAEVIGCDAGTTDFGPHSLATGTSHFSAEAVGHDLDLLLKHARRARLPLLIGSAGTAGGDRNLRWMTDIVRNRAAQRGLHFRLGLIHAELSNATVHQLLEEGRIRALPPAPALSPSQIDESATIVAMMGAEPVQQAMAEGAEVVIAGRCSDSALFAAIPLARGFDPGASWHAAKILECGAAAVTQRVAPDSMVARIRDDGSFEIAPVREDYRCTPQSIASHTLYENSDPFRMTEPSGTLDTTATRYEAVDERTVRVTGSRFEPAPEYTVKLEGARLAGYSTVVLGGVRDPLIIAQLDSWLGQLDRSIRERLERTLGAGAEYQIVTRVYGKDAVMGQFEPSRSVEGHEVAILWDVLSMSQSLSHSIAGSLSHMALHNPIPEWHGLISGLAFPFAPAEVDRGPVYEFHLNHVVVPASPTQLFRIEHLEV